MSVLWISIIFTAGAAGWIFNKLQSRSGYNTSQSLTATGVSAAIIFVILLAILEWGIK